MDWTIPSVVGLVALSVLSGGTAAVVGFGIGSLLTPLLALRLGTEIAVAAVAVPHLLATALRLIQHWAHVDWSVLRRFGVASAVGGLTGAVLVTRLDPRLLTLTLGVLLLMTALANLSPRVRSWQPAQAAAPSLGLLSGLFGGLAGNQGGLRAAALLPFSLAPRPFIATSTAIALVIDLARTPAYVVQEGGALLELWQPIAIAAAGCLAGTVLGERLLLGLPLERFRRIVAGAVGLLGVWLLVQL